MSQRISIALCTFNGGRFVAQQLASLATQTVLPDEVVVADDGSSDDTLKQVQSFAKKANFDIRILKGRVGGPTQNFDRAAKACRGDVIFFCDQDDYWYPKKLETMSYRFRAPDVSAVFCDARLVDENRVTLGKTLWESIGFFEPEYEDFRKSPHKRLLSRTLAFGLTMAVSRDVVEQAGATPMPFGHDGYLALIAAALGRIELCPEPLLDYRQHANQVSSATRQPSWFRRPQNHAIVPTSQSYAAVLTTLADLPKEYAGENYDVVLSELRGKTRHMVFRENLPSKFGARVRAMSSEAITGRYQKYSNGFRSIILDGLRGPGR